jgi:hypothetical protein
MGGISQGLGRAAADAFSDVIGKAYDKLEGNVAGKFGIDMMWSMSRSFKQHPTGEAVYKMAEEGIRQRTLATDKLMAPIHAFEEVAKKNSDVSMKHDYNTATLAQIHNSFPPGHSAQNAIAPLMARPELHAKPLPDIKKILHSEGNMYGREVAFGPGASNLAATIYPMITSQGTERTKAEAWLGILSQVFKDTESIPNVGERSGTKADVAQYINDMHRQLSMAPIKLDVTAEHKAGGKAEALAHHYAMTWLAPLIATAHLADFYKLGTLPAQTLFKTFTNMSDPQINQLKLASGIFFHTVNSIYDNDFKYRTGVVGRTTGLPDAAAFLHKIYHNPLFNNERMLQLSVMGSAGYHSAQMWGLQSVHNVPRAIAELEEMGLDVNAIRNRGGILTDDEMKQAIWHFTNNRLFIDRPMDRARFSQKSPFMRIGSMFHGYITKEGSYLARELMKLARSNDYMAIAQFVGTVGIVFPATAPLLYSLQTLVRTASVEKAKEQLESDYGSLINPTGFGDFAVEYLKLLGHFGSGGAFMQYLHAASNYKLAQNMAGPVPGVAMGTAEDVVHGFMGTKTGGHQLKDWKPAGRDALRYFTIPIFGSWAAQHLLPPKKKGSGGSLRLPSFRGGRRL